MVDTSMLAGWNPFDILDTECARVDKFFANATEDDWKQDTRCEGWRVREILSHFGGVEDYHLACLNDAVQAFVAEGAQNGATDGDSFNAWKVRVRADRSSDDVLEEWRKMNAEVRRRFRELGPDGTMATSVGQYPADLMAWHVSSEYATHADDMHIEIDDSERPDRLAWRIAVSKFALSETEKPVEVKSSGGKNVITSGDKSVILSDHDFVEAVTARLPTDYPIDPELRRTLISLA